MENPLSKLKQAYGNTDFAKGRAMNKEIQAAGLDKADIHDLILEDKGEDDNFAKFLSEIEPNFGNLDTNTADVQQFIREKYLLFKQYKGEQTKLKGLYKTEIAGELGIDIPAEKEEEAFSEMESAMRKMAQTETARFQELKAKIAEYESLKVELGALQQKLEKKVGLKGHEALQAMDDRQKRGNIAEGKFFIHGSSLKENIKRDFARGVRDTERKGIAADMKVGFKLEGEALEQEMAESGGDIKRTKELKEKVDALREYFLKELDFGQKLINVAKTIARDNIRESVKHGMGESGIDRLDTMTKRGREIHRELLRDENKRLHGGNEVFEGLPTELQAEWDRLDELDKLDELEDVDPKKITGEQKTQLEKFRQNKLDRTKKRISSLEKARSLTARMNQGVGKEGGVNYRRNFVDSEGVYQEMTAENSFGTEVYIDDDFESDLELATEDLIKRAFSDAAVSSTRIDQFVSKVSEYLGSWRIGSQDSRSKVQDFIGKCFSEISVDAKVPAQLKVQLKAYMGKHGIGNLKIRI